VFVLSFDTGTMTVYDPTSGDVETRITVGRGPQGVAIDSDNALAYVALFTDSYVSVVDLDKRHATYGQILLNLGIPTPPVSSK
jgi:DNA-binding beta-propeller fold protein YncE